MIRRCLPESRVNPKKLPYGWNVYGGKGIRVCRRWHKFENFLKDMGEKPEGMSISRRMDMGDYCPGNVTWATRKEQFAEAAKKREYLKAKKAAA